VVGIDVPHHEAIERTQLPTRFFSIPLDTLLAERLPARALTEVLAFDVISRIAFGVVMMHWLFDRVPSRLDSHSLVYSCN
jgi:hypothetical protein